MTPRINAAAEFAKPIALDMIDRGFELEPAVRMGALLAAFLDKNQPVFDARIAAGQDPEVVADEAMDAFKVFALNSLK